MKRLLVLVVLLPVAWAAAGCGGSPTVSENSKKGLPAPGYEGMEKRMLMEKQAMMKQKGTAPAAPTK